MISTPEELAAVDLSLAEVVESHDCDDYECFGSGRCYKLGEDGKGTEAICQFEPRCHDENIEGQSYRRFILTDEELAALSELTRKAEQGEGLREAAVAFIEYADHDDFSDAALERYWTLYHLVDTGGE